MRQLTEVEAGPDVRASSGQRFAAPPRFAALIAVDDGLVAVGSFPTNGAARDFAQDLEGAGLGTGRGAVRLAGFGDVASVISPELAPGAVEAATCRTRRPGAPSTRNGGPAE